ncbi:MAG TPA: tRNA (adenosine(37)-N6)-threonylcarbamoyltransferase complex dimerization subunit type 1 TsaB [Pseudomonadales bacterium]
MTVILALDTSTEACSCALAIDGRVHERYVVAPQQHASLILSSIETLLREHGLGFEDLDAVAWGRGPGSFTGLRIAAGVTQGIAFAAELPVIEVSTLAALALAAWEEQKQTRVFACLDARIDEVYWGLFEIRDGLPIAIAPEQLCKPEAIPGTTLDAAAQWCAVGNGLAYGERFPAEVHARFAHRLPEALPRAGHIAALAAAAFERGEIVGAEQVRPVYLRDKVTHH